MTCTCGLEMSVDADDRDAAVKMMQGQMDQAALDKHWEENHQSDQMPKPTLEQSHAMIEQTLHEVAVAA